MQMVCVSQAGLCLRVWQALMEMPALQLLVVSQIKGIPASLDSFILTFLVLRIGARQQTELNQHLPYKKYLYENTL